MCPNFAQQLSKVSRTIFLRACKYKVNVNIYTYKIYINI